MANMSYCRFRNTETDLRDCLDHINDELTDPEEIEARERMVKLCKRFIYAAPEPRET